MTTLVNGAAHHPAPLVDWAAKTGARRVLSRILLANNGIAAVKGIRSIRKWSYDTFGTEKIITFIAMATPEDMQANAEYVRMADEVVEVPGLGNQNNYANVDLIVEVAQRKDAHAVWAGWGHASENPRLPHQLAAANIVFMGPGERAMQMLGDKIGSSILAQSAGVPSLPWSGDHVECPSDSDVTPTMYDDACVTNVEDCVARGKKIGFPIMIKAAEGGGGKGIRPAHNEEQLVTGFRQVAAEVAGCHIFLMKMATKVRHLEVQVLSDECGNAISLYGRDCSIQRRCQKIIEEGPVTAANDEVFTRMEGAAVRLAQRVGYVGAGTVEYLYADGEFHFLEMNPRLQVEHPVSEMLTDVNMPAAMLLVAMGLPLHANPCIRKLYAQAKVHDCIESFDLALQNRVKPQRHVIAARITAENPDKNFQPTSGLIKELVLRTSPNVWGYFSVVGSSGVHEYADSQIGHIFSSGPTREMARKNLVLALKGMTVNGEIRTTIESLVGLLETDAFRKSTFNTQWLDGLLADNALPKARLPTDLTVICGALAQATARLTASRDEFVRGLEVGRVPVTSLLETSVEVVLVLDEVKYITNVRRTGLDRYAVTMNGTSVMTEVRSLSDTGMLVYLAGESHLMYSREEAMGYRLTVDGCTIVFQHEYDPSKLLASMPGKVVKFLVRDGGHVKKGQPYVEMEVMKMYMQLPSPESGTLRLALTEGSIVKAGDTIGQLDLDDVSTIKKATLYTEPLPSMQPPSMLGLGCHQLLRAARTHAKELLQGYTEPSRSPIEQATAVVKALMSNLSDPRLRALETLETLSSVKSHLPAPLCESMTTSVNEYLEKANVVIKAHKPQHSSDTRPSGMASLISTEHQSASDVSELEWLSRGADHPQLVFPAVELLAQIEAVVSELCEEEGTALRKVIAPLVTVLTRHTTVWRQEASTVIAELLEQYLHVEESFALGLPLEEVVVQLKDRLNDDNVQVYEAMLSHTGLAVKNMVVRELCRQCAADPRLVSQRCANALAAISSLQGAAYSEIAVVARQLQVKLEMPSFTDRLKLVEDQLMESVHLGVQVRASGYTSTEGFCNAVGTLVDHSLALEEELFTFVGAPRPLPLRLSALELYVRRSHRAYSIKELNISTWTLDAAPVKAPQWALVSENPIALEDCTDDFLLLTEWGFSPKQTIGRKNMPRVDSMQALNNMDVELPDRRGVLAAATSLNDIERNITAILGRFPSQGVDTKSEAMLRDLEGSFNILYGVVWAADCEDDESKLSARFRAMLQTHKGLLHTNLVSRATLVVVRPSGYPYFYTFRRSLGYDEDRIYRHVDPPLAFQLELSRLSPNYDIEMKPYHDRQVHVYFATDKVDPEDKPERRSSLGTTNRRDAGGRLMVRALVIRGGDSRSRNPEMNAKFVFNEAERVLLESCNALEIARGSMKYAETNVMCNHLFINILPVVQMDEDAVGDRVCEIVQRNSNWLRELRVTEIEISISTAAPYVSSDMMFKMRQPLRFVLSNPTGVVLQMHAYREMVSEQGDVYEYAALYPDVPDMSGPLVGLDVYHAYPKLTVMERRRTMARFNETTYVYDFPQLFAQALEDVWREHLQKVPSTSGAGAGSPTASLVNTVIEAIELEPVKDDDDGTLRLVPTDRPGGQNDCGMVVWRVRMRTPECPGSSSPSEGDGSWEAQWWGREMIIIANDITFINGSFGPTETRVFQLASILAREEGIPRVYLAANSGARIGLAKEVQDVFGVKWKADADGASKSGGNDQKAKKRKKVAAAASKLSFAEDEEEEEP